MKNIIHRTLIAAALLFTTVNAWAGKELFNNDWKFATGNAASMQKDFTHGTEYFTYFSKVNSNDHNRGPAWNGFDDTGWKTVNLPHDWAVDLPYSREASHSHGYKCIGWKYPENSVGWYRKHFFISEEDKGKEMGVEFEGIFRDAEVFCNGIYLGHERSGYAVQYYKLTDVLNYGGENVITVRCDASVEEGWYYEGAGIYRNVWLHRGGYRPEEGPGSRDIRFDSERGFLLDGKRVQLRGCDLHLDAAGVGVAVPKELWRYRLNILKEYGFNCIRSSHNPAPEDLLDLCDEMEFFVIDENRCFGSNEEQLRGLENMIAHHRHHPCIIAWSVGNEEWSVEWDERGTAMAKSMSKRAHKVDPTRPTTYGSSGGQAPNHGVDVFGYNYIVQNPIDRNHKDFPDHCALGTEETTGCGTRGEYTTNPQEGWMLSHNRRDSIDHIETGWRFYKERPWLAGLCYWTGFDYRGEPNPMSWPATGSQFGIFDYCGFPKDEAYYLKSWWTDEPVLHICGPANGHVRVYSNCEKVELFQGKKSLGRKTMPRDGHLDWEVSEETAAFTAKGYVKGRRILTDTYPEAIKGTALKASKTVLKADGQDVAVIDIISPEACLDVCVEGATFLGWGNGNPGFKEIERPSEGNSLSIRTFNGRAQVLVRSVEGAKGPVTVTVGNVSLPLLAD